MLAWTTTHYRKTGCHSDIFPLGKLGILRRNAALQRFSMTCSAVGPIEPGGSLKDLAELVLAVVAQEDVKDFSFGALFAHQGIL